MSDGDLTEQKANMRAMAMMGCDREMAAKAVGWSLDELRQVFREDPEFAKVLLRAEGQAEFQRMRNLHEATQDQKNWRAATWWLERRAENRYGKRASRHLTAAELQAFIEEIVDLVYAEVTREADRERLMVCLLAVRNSWDEQVRDVLPQLTEDVAREGDHGI